MLSPQDAWQAALDHLQLKMARPTFDTWLSGAEFVSYANDEFVVRVRHAYAKDWLERHLLKDMTQTLSRIFARIITIKLIVHLPHRNKTKTVQDAGPLFAGLQPSAAPAAGESPRTLGSSASALLPAADHTPAPAAPESGTEDNPADKPVAEYSEWDPRVRDVRSTAEIEKEKANASEAALPLIDTFTFDTFVTGPSNQFAHMAAKAIVDSPGTRYNPVVFFGGVGLGKTHLLNAIGHECEKRGRRVLYVTAETFTNETIAAIRSRKTDELRQRYRYVDVLLMDDLQFMAGKSSTEEEFYHTFNAIVARGGQIVIATNANPRQLTKLDDRLLSRLEGGLIADIQVPEEETRRAILRVKSTAQGVALPDEVAQKLAELAIQNVRELEGLLTQVLARAQLAKQPLTLALAQQVLKKQGIEVVAERVPHLSQVFEAAAEYHQLSLDDLLSKRRTQKIARARQIAMYLAREVTGASLPQIGEALGGRNHTTVLYGCKKIATAIQDDVVLRDEVIHIRENLLSPD